jgi:7-carboxy-7-deazaguanine synthase
MARNLLDQLHSLGPRDQIKFVICDRADYEWSRALVSATQWDGKPMVLFSPSHQQLPARELAGWILEDRLPVRLQVQLHKILWGDEPGR